MSYLLYQDKPCDSKLNWPGISLLLPGNNLENTWNFMSPEKWEPCDSYLYGHEKYRLGCPFLANHWICSYFLIKYISTLKISALLHLNVRGFILNKGKLDKKNLCPIRKRFMLSSVFAQTKCVKLFQKTPNMYCWKKKGKVHCLPLLTGFTGSSKLVFNLAKHPTLL